MYRCDKLGHHRFTANAILASKDEVRAWCPNCNSSGKGQLLTADERKLADSVTIQDANTFMRSIQTIVDGHNGYLSVKIFQGLPHLLGKSPGQSDVGAGICKMISDRFTSLIATGGSFLEFWMEMLVLPDYLVSGQAEYDRNTELSNVAKQEIAAEGQRLRELVLASRRAAESNQISGATYSAEAAFVADAAARYESKMNRIAESSRVTSSVLRMSNISLSRVGAKSQTSQLRGPLLQQLGSGVYELFMSSGAGPGAHFVSLALLHDRLAVMRAADPIHAWGQKAPLYVMMDPNSGVAAFRDSASFKRFVADYFESIDYFKKFPELLIYAPA